MKQELRQNLYVKRSETGLPLIAKYHGRGALASWLKTISIRTAGKHLDRQKEIPVDDQTLEIVQPRSEEMELLQFKSVYHREFKSSFAEALNSLEQRDRQILKLHYLERRSIDEIGETLGKHRATAARWVIKARDELALRTREGLSARLDLTPTALESVMGMIVSQIDLSFRALSPKAATKS